MKQEQIISIIGTNIYTNGGRRIAIGNADHHVGDWVWVDSGCVFGHKAAVQNALYVPESKMEGFIEVDALNYKICGLDDGFPVLAEYPIDIADGWLVYDQTHFAFLYFTQGQVRIKDYTSDGAVETTVSLPDNLYPQAKDAYYDHNGDLNWAVFLRNSELSVCKIMHYKNQDLVSTTDFTEQIAVAISEYEIAINADIIGKISNYRFGTYNEIVFGNAYPVFCYFGGDLVPGGVTHKEFVGTAVYSDYSTTFTMSFAPTITSMSLWDKTIQINLHPTFQSTTHNNSGVPIISSGLKTENLISFSGSMNYYLYHYNTGVTELLNSSGPHTPWQWKSYTLTNNYNRVVLINSNGFEVVDTAKGITGSMDYWVRSANLFIDGANHSIESQKRQVLSWAGTEIFPHLLNYSLTLANGVVATFQAQSDGQHIIALTVDGESYDVSEQSDYSLNYSIPPIVTMKNGVILYLATNSTFWRIESDAIASIPVGNLLNLQMPIIKISKSKFKNLFKV